ncbi:response regulator, partial [Vibrio alginolyticus]
MGASLVEVLVIEDDQVLGAQLGELLRLQGYRVRSSPLGECGLAMALTKAPDLILLDVMLPDVNGFSVLRRLREQQQTPVIMLTACGAEEE